MNKDRRKRLERIQDEIGPHIAALIAELEDLREVRDEEQEALDNMAEKFSGTERYSEMEEGLQSLEEAIGYLEAAEEMESAGEAIGNLL